VFQKADDQILGWVDWNCGDDVDGSGRGVTSWKSVVGHVDLS